MSATVLDGSATARKIRQALGNEVRVFTEQTGVEPRLDVIMAGDDPASVTYVNMKRKACLAAGMRSEIHILPGDCTQEEMLGLVRSLNEDESVHGMLVQHPVPKHLDEQAILDAVSPGKDVDGISSESLGRLLTGKPGFRPCTPQGILTLLDEYDVPIKGQRAVVLGRSIILGKPAALLLLERHATAGSGGDLPNRGHPRRGCRETGVRSRSVGETRRLRHRRRIQPRSGEGARCRGRGLRRCGREGRVDHTGSWRRRPDDDRHSPAEYLPVRPSLRGRLGFPPSVPESARYCPCGTC